MKKCRYCDKLFEEHSASSRNDPNYWIEEEENKMKCPKCGNEMYKMQSKKDCYVCEVCGESPIVRQQNPSPRDIFREIGRNHEMCISNGYAKDECERRAFDEFMKYQECLCLLPWEAPISNNTLKWIRIQHHIWYEWLCNKGLVQKEKVKREAWVNFYIQDGFPGVDRLLSYRTEKEASAIADKLKGYVKTILLHEWEEEK